MAHRILFKFGGDLIETVWSEQGLMFYDPSSNMWTSPEGLRITKTGVIKEFPDLENDDEWKKKALQRLKDHIKSLKTEDEIQNYIINELIKYGYEPMCIQKAGHRPKKWNGNH